MANRRRRYCVYFSRRYVDVFNTFYFVFKIFYFLFKIFYFLFKIFYFLSKIFYFVCKIFSCVYFFRRPVGVIRAINFVCNIFNFRLEKAKETYVIFEIVRKVRPPQRDFAFGANSSFAGHLTRKKTVEEEAKKLQI